MAHCLNPLYISNSHCDQRTKAWHIRVLLWTLDAGAARQKQSFWLCGTKRQRSFVLRSTATLGTFCLSHTQVTLPWPLLQTLWLGIVIAADLDQLVKINGGQRWIFSHGRDASWLSITRGKKKSHTIPAYFVGSWCEFPARCEKQQHSLLIELPPFLRRFYLHVATALN